jgi:hypothetical protein
MKNTYTNKKTYLHHGLVGFIGNANKLQTLLTNDFSPSWWTNTQSNVSLSHIHENNKEEEEANSSKKELWLLDSLSAQAWHAK